MMENRRRRLLGNRGEMLYYEPRTGCYYPKHLNITVTPSSGYTAFMAKRYALCSEMETAIVQGVATIGGSSGAGNDTFSYSPKLKRLALPDGCGGNTYICTYSPMLENVELGSVGHPVEKIYANAFNQSGTSAQNKTITVYVDGTSNLPLADEPWGYSGATVIYRNAATGEIIEEATG